MHTTTVPMLKITILDSARELRLRLEGKLSGPWVGELRLCWQTASSTTAGRNTVTDLREVDFVDPEGQRLLADMHRAGVSFDAASPLIRTMLNEIVRDPQTFDLNPGHSPLFQEFQDRAAKASLKSVLLHSDDPLNIRSQGAQQVRVQWLDEPGIHYCGFNSPAVKLGSSLHGCLYRGTDGQDGQISPFPQDFCLPNG